MKVKRTLRGLRVEESRETESIELQDKRKLGIATLGALKQHPRISAFRQFIEGWHLSYFTPDAARSLPLAGPQRHLNDHGDNLGNVVQFMEREHPERFKRILARIAGKIPGIDSIDTEISPDRRLLLRFNNKRFRGSILRATDVRRHAQSLCPIFCCSKIRRLHRSSVSKNLKTACTTNFSKFWRQNSVRMQPEGRMRHKFSSPPISRTSWMRSHRKRHGSSKRVRMGFRRSDGPAMTQPSRRWWTKDCHSAACGTAIIWIRRTSDDATVKAMMDEGLPLGSLWYSDYLDPTDQR